ncbi:hypothetical protein, partial [Paraburkholderia tropica]|uniref:hypothetical protein n=1 Tax=Paraburkholderia tropica TaxID=92647 RepID=UPI001C8F64A2
MPGLLQTFPNTLTVFYSFTQPPIASRSSREKHPARTVSAIWVVRDARYCSKIRASPLPGLLAASQNIWQPRLQHY